MCVQLRYCNINMPSFDIMIGQYTYCQKKKYNDSILQIETPLRVENNPTMSLIWKTIYKCS